MTAAPHRALQQGAPSPAKPPGRPLVDTLVTEVSQDKCSNRRRMRCCLCFPSPLSCPWLPTEPRHGTRSGRDRRYDRGPAECHAGQSHGIDHCAGCAAVGQYVLVKASTRRGYRHQLIVHVGNVVVAGRAPTGNPGSAYSFVPRTREPAFLDRGSCRADTRMGRPEGGLFLFTPATLQ
jgi:hypothetical protein